MWRPGWWQVIEGGGGGRPGGQCYEGGGHQNEGIGRQGHQDDIFFPFIQYCYLLNFLTVHKTCIVLYSILSGRTFLISPI